jgi:hypothetical protein
VGAALSAQLRRGAYYRSGCGYDVAYEPGQSGNPAGRPIGARQRISEKLLADLAVVWEEHGQEVLHRLAKEEPAGDDRLWPAAQGRLR